MAQDIIHILFIDDDEDDYLITRDLLSDIEDQRFRRAVKMGANSVVVAIQSIVIETLSRSSCKPIDVALERTIIQFSHLRIPREGWHYGQVEQAKLVGTGGHRGGASHGEGVGARPRKHLRPG